MSLSFLGGVDVQVLLQHVNRRAEADAVIELLLADQEVCAGVRGLLSCLQHCLVLRYFTHAAGLGSKYQ